MMITSGLTTSLLFLRISAYYEDVAQKRIDMPSILLRARASMLN